MAIHAGGAEGRRGNRWRPALWSVAGLMLLAPLFAAQFTDGVDWDLHDYAIFGAMLLGAGFTCEMAVRSTGSTAYRAATVLAVAGAFLLVWMNLAVGIIGSEDHPANLVFDGVLAVGITSAALARFQPYGMARALTATALAQALAAAVALIAGWGSAGAKDTGEILFLNGFYVMLWLTSAWLFRRAARQQIGAGSAP
ncbi:hypothetical protein KBI52_23840 [Microvirga sp. HBU67558]|uniref:hypothetical protein n=1 Tax=Microvirga TaxID=186650 RepID=UPI001B37184A|nr:MULTISPECIES: hypothetical protein [unclassified Microvirga]MBQ0823226.1 hypothetical protein [Microvirga sp. HBU67558]